MSSPGQTPPPDPPPIFGGPLTTWDLPLWVYAALVVLVLVSLALGAAIGVRRRGDRAGAAPSSRRTDANS